ncbi:MAG: VWA domain-containing protein [Chlamydiae bacterium]|nr:VWA domain-containing protein [Chlamydiota bacterium]
MNFKFSKKISLGFCIGVSLLAHVVSFYLLQKHSFWITAPHHSEKDVAFISSMPKKMRNQILKETFQKICANKAPTSFFLSEIPYETSFLFISPQFEAAEVEISKQPLFADPKAGYQPPSSLNLPKHAPLVLSEHVSKNLFTPSPTEFPSHKQNPSPQPKTPFKAAATLTPGKIAPITKKQNLAMFSLSSEVESPPKIVEIFPLPDFPTLEDLGAASFSEDFSAEISFLPIENESYIFAITLIPNPDFQVPKLHQHYSFLIDRSNSIQKDRLSAVKSAVSKALEELTLEDSFNIIAFDSRADKFAPTSVAATPRTIQAAKRFVEQIQLGNFFATASLSKPLYSTVPFEEEEGELYTSILFSDGETLKKRASQLELARDWTYQNQGRAHLFAIGIEGDPQVSTIDAITALNRGKTYLSPTKRGIKRKVLKLLKTLRHPIATHLSVKTVGCSPGASLSLYPKSYRLPSLYLHEPYVILGKTERLDDFILFVQGKLKNQWFNIKKRISFVNAKKGGKSLQEEWSLQQAYELYHAFLLDLNPSHLAEAESLLQPHAIQKAFQ